MKHDEDFSQRAELEARIVAWVLGEASPFEIAELTRHVAADPELAAFKREIEQLHGIVAQATHPTRPALRMAAEKRAQLLSVLKTADSHPVTGLEKTVGSDSDAGNGPQGTILALPLLGQEKRSWRLPVWASAAAACVLLGVFVFVQMSRHELAEARIAKFEAERRVNEADAVTQMRRKEMVAALQIPVAEETEAEPARTVAASSKRKAAIAGYFDQATLPSIPAQPRLDYYNRADSAMLGASTRSQGIVSGFEANQPAITGISGDKATFGLQAAPQWPTETVNGDEIVKMSPFEVRADPELGYAAASTLAGTRLTTSLLDVGSALSVSVHGSLADTRASGWKSASYGSRNAPKKSEDILSFLAPGSRPIAEEPASKSLEKKTDEPAAEADGSAPHPAAAPPPEARQETATRDQSVSTFSLHVGDTSFRLAKAALEQGQVPDANAIRPEEFYNAFDYGDPAAAAGEPVTARIEQARHPFLQQRNLVRIAVRVPSVGRDAAQALRLTLLLDTSGSMEREDRVATVRSALQVLASLLHPDDQVTLIGFARQPRLLAERVTGGDASRLADLIARIPAEGGTNLEAALRLAGEKARAQFDAGAQNRIIVITDGAANLGNDDPALLAQTVAQLRQQGISFDACGVGVAGLDDTILESLTRKGDGRYYVINSPEDADAGFARKLAGALRPAAQNVKVQVRFNPARVSSYRLLGFEQHRLKTEDFRNDKVTAAELAGDENAVALYEVQPNPEGEGELGEVFVRFRSPGSGTTIERSWPVLHDPHAAAFDRAAPSMQLAGLAALLAEMLQGGPRARAIELNALAPVIQRVRTQYGQQPAVNDLLQMIAQTQRLSGR